MINQTKANSQLTVRSLAEMFGCGRTQISDILKNKEGIISAYESNASTIKKMATKASTLLTEVAAYQASTMQQTTLTHFFPRN